MAAWQASRPGDRIVEVDIPLSYGVYDVVQDQYLLNTVEFLWDPTKEVGVYIKVRILFVYEKYGKGSFQSLKIMKKGRIKIEDSLLVAY